MMRSTTAFLAIVLCSAACKGSSPTTDPQTKADLDQCLKDKAEKDKLIKAEEDETARLLRDKGSGGEIVVSIENNIMTVHPPAAGQPEHPIPDAQVAAASKEFVNVVEKSRGAIQKCYEQALRKDSGLQSRSITVSIYATFGSTGGYKSSSFSPSLGSTFDACMQTVASKWSLSASSPAMTFKAPVSLTPS